MSARLNMLAELIPACDTVADIGADHGQLGALLLSEGKCRRVIACDISEKAISKAAALYKSEGLAGRAETRVGDGLSVLYEGEAQAIVIAGMGAKVMSGILERGRQVASQAELVLSPTIDVERLREFLQREGYAITRESLCRDGGRWRVGIRAKAGEMPALSAEELLAGRYLYDQEGFEDYIGWRIGVMSRVQTPQGRAALEILLNAKQIIVQKGFQE